MDDAERMGKTDSTAMLSTGRHAHHWPGADRIGADPAFHLHTGLGLGGAGGDFADRAGVRPDPVWHGEVREWRCAWCA